MKTSNGYNPKVVKAFFKEYGVPEPEFEYRFDPERKWRFDVAFHTIKMSPGIEGVAIEVQGGLFTGGAHVRGARLLAEYEKLNRAACLGWRVLFVTPQQLCTKEVVDMVRWCLGLCPVPDKHIGQASSL